MKLRYFTFVLLALTLVSGSVTIAQEKKSTTTQEAAEAKEREGKTGTSNENAAKQLEKLEKETAEKPTPPPKSEKGN